MEPVRVAAVSLGRWANVLAGAYTRSDMVKLVTCFSPGSAKRDAFSARYGCGQDESLEAMLQRDDVEAVIVTVPNDQHADVIEQAAAAGKHVYVEKAHRHCPGRCAANPARHHQRWCRLPLRAQRAPPGWPAHDQVLH